MPSIQLAVCGKNYPEGRDFKKSYKKNRMRRLKQERLDSFQIRQVADLQMTTTWRQFDQ